MNFKVDTRTLDNPMRRRLIFFDGVDKVGKTTLSRAFMRGTNHDVLANLDRGPMGRVAYARYFKEDQRIIDDMIALQHQLMVTDSYAVVLLTCHPSVIQNRMRANNDIVIPEEQLVDQQLLMLEEFERLRKAGTPVLHIDTNATSIMRSIQLLLEFTVATWKGGDNSGDALNIYDPS